MKPHHLYLLLLTAITITVGACADNSLTGSDPPTNDSTDSTPKDSTDTLISEIMPLKVGNRWIYREQHLDTNGIPVETLYDTLEIVDRHFINNEWWYEDSEGTLMTNRQDGLWRLVDSTEGHYSFTAKHPAEVGQVFIVDTASPPGFTGVDIVTKRTVLSTNAEVTVPAGTFRGIQYRMSADRRNGDPYIPEWNTILFVPGKGWVYSESWGYYYNQKGTAWYRWELVSADLQ